MPPTSPRILPAILLLTLSATALADPPARPRPAYLSAVAAESIDPNAPIATPEDERAMLMAARLPLQDIDNLSNQEAAETSKTLMRVGAAQSNSGARRLLLLKAYELAKRAAKTPEDLAAAANAALAALDGPTIPLTAKRIAILTDSYDLLPKDPNFAPPIIADATYTLAELHFSAGNFADAQKDLAAAQKWTALDADYAARMKTALARFTAALDGQVQTEKTLAATPNDPAANAVKALSLLSRSQNPKDAVPFLEKSSQPELRRLATAIAAPQLTPAAQLEAAAAATAAFPITSAHDQVALAYLTKHYAQSAAKHKQSTEEEKATAQKLLASAATVLANNKHLLPPPGPAFAPVKFIGLEIRPAKKIVFIIDHSGSMLDNFDFLRQEAIKSVTDLRPSQSFNVMMVSEELTPMYDELQPASPETIKDFPEQMGNFRAQGSNDDLLEPFKDAFKQAFALQPDAIIFLTDGHFDPRLSAAVQALNEKKSVRISTLAFVNKEPSYEEQLKEMAKQNGGMYKFVTEKDLGQ